MKGTFIIRNIILTILILAIITGVAYYFITTNNRKYEIEKVEQYNYFVLKQNGKTGVIDRSGNIVIDAKYDDIKIPNPQKDVFVCYNEGNSQILNSQKEQILTNYQNIEPIRLQNIASNLMFEKSVLSYKENDKYGLINFQGKKITKPIYDEISGLSYKEGELLVKQNDKYGVINIKGHKLIDIKYDKIAVDGYYTNDDGYKKAGYIITTTTQEGYRYGYINYNGKLILKPEYNELSRITDITDNENAYLLCAKNGQFGVNKNEKEIVKNEYQSISYDKTNNLLVVEKSKKYGIASLDGKVIVPAQFLQIDVIGNYLYAKNEQGTIVYDNQGKETNMDTNVAILDTGNDKYKIKINNQNGTKYGLITKEGKTLIEEKYSYMEYLYNDYFIVSNEKSKLGVIDNKDTVKIKIENDSVQKIEGTDLIQVVVANTTKLYDKTMNNICEMENATVEVNNDYIKIYNDKQIQYFSKDGKELKNTETYPNNELFSKQENGKWGFVNKNGSVIIEAKYDKVTEFNEYGYAAVNKDGKWGAINQKGEEVVEPMYTINDNNEPSFIGKYYQVRYGFGEVYYTDAK